MNERKKIKDNVFARWLGRPVGVIAWSTAILLAGFWAITQVPLEWAPQIELPRITISASWPGASPRSVERYVTAPIERAVQRVAGTEKVESFSRENSASVSVSIHEDISLSLYVAQLNEQLTLLRDVLPDRVTPRLTKQIPDELKDEQGFMSLQLIGPLSSDDLRKLADRTVKTKLLSIGGIAEIEVIGGTQREILISLDSEKLSALGIGPDDVTVRVHELFRDEAFGRLRGKARSALLFQSSLQSSGGLGDLVLTQAIPGRDRVLLKDVGNIASGPAPVRSISRIDGDPVVTLRIDRARASHMIHVAEAVHATVEGLVESLPEGVRLLVADDRSEEIRQQLQDVKKRGGLGLVLVLIVLLFMLRSIRAMIVVVFSVGVSLSMAFLLLGPLGLTLNLLTIAGLVLIFGLLVDNAVVVVEQLLIRRGGGAEWAALQAVWLPLVGGTASTIVVMLPLIYLSGELKDLFLPFGILVALTMTASLITAALVVPVAGRYLPAHQLIGSKKRPLRKFIAFPHKLAARFPKSTLCLFILLLGLPVWKIPSQLAAPNKRDANLSAPIVRLASLYNDVMDWGPIESTREWVDPAMGGVMRKFLREVSFGAAWKWEARPEVYVRMTFPPGHPIERADSLMASFERSALASSSVFRTILDVREESAYLRIQIKRDAINTSEPYEMRERLISQAVNIGGLYIYVGGLVQDGYSSGFGGGISGSRLEAVGTNYEDLDRLIEDFIIHLKGRSRRVASVDGNSGRFGRFRQARQILSFKWNADSQARSRVTASQVAGTLRPIFRTRFPIRYADIDGDVQLPIRIEVMGSDRRDVDRVVEQPLIINDSLSIQLASLANYSIEERPASIQRENQQYIRYINVDFRGPQQMANDFLEREIATFATPVGYEIRKTQFSFFTEEVKKAFGWVAISTIILVFLVTASVFESWKLPLIVLLSVPMAGIGVAAAFLWSGANFAEGAFIGTILMIGIAVNDSILLTDRYRQLRLLRPHGNSTVLMRLAVRERLRPMITTTLTSIVAMLPMIAFPDASDFWMGLAVTVIGGLTASTLFAPLVSVSVVSLRFSRSRNISNSIVSSPAT